MARFAEFYNTRAWRRLSRWRRSVEPLCRKCSELGRVTLGQAADHIVPLAEDWDRRLDPDNTQTLCGPCHSSVKAREERTGQVVGNDVSGEPLDKGSAWWTR